MMKGINMLKRLEQFVRRMLFIYFLITVFTLCGLARLSIKGYIEVAGIYAGIIVGLVGGIFELINLGRSARKHEFTIVARHPKMTLVVSFIIIPIVTVSTVLILLRLKHYFPQINQTNERNICITFLGVALAVYFVISTVGVYWLERRYGEKFYLGRGR